VTDRLMMASGGTIASSSIRLMLAGWALPAEIHSLAGTTMVLAGRAAYSTWRQLTLQPTARHYSSRIGWDTVMRKAKESREQFQCPTTC
jgi:hypothetical protein